MRSREVGADGNFAMDWECRTYQNSVHPAQQRHRRASRARVRVQLVLQLVKPALMLLPQLRLCLCLLVL